jgi:hypothetical protein
MIPTLKHHIPIVWVDKSNASGGPGKKFAFGGGKKAARMELLGPLSVMCFTLFEVELETMKWKESQANCRDKKKLVPPTCSCEQGSNHPPQSGTGGEIDPISRLSSAK